MESVDDIGSSGTAGASDPGIDPLSAPGIAGDWNMPSPSPVLRLNWRAFMVRAASLVGVAAIERIAPRVRVDASLQKHAKARKQSGIGIDEVIQ